MSLLETLATIGQKRAADPGIIAGGGGAILNRSFGFGGRELTARDLTAAYNDLTFAFLTFRASEIGSQILGARVERQGAQQEWEEVERSFPWVALLQRPNPNIPPLELWQWAVQIYDAWGHADFLVEDGTVGGIPVPKALHPLYPEFGTLYPKIGSTGGKTGWIYYDVGGKQTSLELEDIVSIRRPHPVDPRRTASLIEASAYSIDTEAASTIYARDAARQQGRPNVVLEAAGDIEESQMKKMGRDFYRQYSLREVKGVPVLANGLKATPVQLNARDQQFIQTREFTQSRMFQIWQMAEGLFSDKANRANAEAAQYQFARFVVQPVIKAILSQVEFSFERIFRADPAALRIQPPDVIPVDREQQAKIDDMKIKSGVKTVNEIRKRDGGDDVDGGDQALVSAGLVPLDQVGILE